jgi:molybdenum cofactor biosynthesis protein B
MTQSLTIAVLTVSDTRTQEDDRSGQSLVEKLEAAGHRLAQRVIVQDDIYKIRAQVSQWIADEHVQVVLVTGGTGFAKRDVTPDALFPLFDKTIDGFGELFRQISVQQIGTSAVQSRALAGLANKTLIFGLPGSPNACRTAWDDILVHQLDSTHKPCNFVSIIFNDPT